ncbi:MAG: hypothetical protein FWD86_00165 [Firmicutes bacterium]|nr:hypothetical protein [Bacillota bacterium]
MYKDLIKSTPAFDSIPKNAQSYLFCGFDALACDLFAHHFIADQTNKPQSADIIHLPKSDKVLVADIDFLTQSSIISPLELPHKYFVVKNADSMTESAANKLLKTLEEPPKKVKIILLASSPHAVLPTIKSRCAIVNIPPFDQAKLDKIIDTDFAANKHAAMAKELSMGSLERMKKALDGEFEKKVSAVFEMLLFMRKSSQIVQFSGLFLAFKDDLADLIWILEVALADAAKFLCKAELTFKSRRSDIEQICLFYNVETVLKMEQVFAHLKQRLRFSGNVQSIIDQLLFSLLQTRQKNAT